MEYCDVYIGDLCDPKFSWDGGDWNNNIPRTISPFFPPVKGQNDLPYRTVVDHIKKGTLDGKQTDSASWVARITKPELRALAKEMYGAAPDLKVKTRFKEVNHLYEHIEELDDHKKYALVATTGSEK